MKSLPCCILVFLFCLSPLSLFSQTEPAAMDMSDFDVSKVTTLDGTWKLYLNSLLKSESEAVAYPKMSFPPMMVHVPSVWDRTYKTLTGEKAAAGFGTYLVRLTGLDAQKRYGLFIKDSPSTACSIFINGTFAAASGRVSADVKNTKPANIPLYMEFSPAADGSAEIAVQVSNAVYRKGGLWASVYFGEKERIFKFYNTNTGLIFFVVGTLLFLCFMNLMMFILSPKNLTSLYFAIFLGALAARVSTAEFNVLGHMLPSLSYASQIKFAFSAIWLAPPAALFFFCAAVPLVRTKKWVKYSYAAVQLVQGFLCAVFPVYIVNRMLPILYTGTIFGLIYVFIILFRALWQGDKLVVVPFVSVIVMGGGALYDIFFAATNGGLPFSILPFSVSLLAVLQFIFLSYRESMLFGKQVQLTRTLKKLNDSYIRFVPEEFIGLLNKRSIAEVNLGDHVETEMAILFSQIYLRGVDVEVNPLDQYDVFRDYSLIFSGLISEYRGFISKFISRGLIALFPGGSEDAIKCSLEMQKKIHILNSIRHNVDKPAICIGIGIHYGNMILGTIGEESRLDDTVISDTVNTAARIENIAEVLHRTILISLDAIERSDLAQNTELGLVPLGNIHVKGRRKSVELFECQFLEKLTNLGEVDLSFVDDIEKLGFLQDEALP